jgi:uncharacterized protein (TIRG00374 family)
MTVEVPDRVSRESAATDDPAARANTSLLRGLLALGILAALVVGLLLALPGLRGVAHAISRMDGSWLAVAVGLEILSCLSYVIVFLQVFDRAPIVLGARVALTELAFGAVVGLGGAGSLAVGAWLLVDRGAAPARVVERSAVLFLLTSAINVITLVLAAAGLAAGVLSGPRSALLSVVPAVIGTVVIGFFAVLPALIDRGLQRLAPSRLHRALRTSAVGVRDATRLLLSGDPKLLGAIGFLWFDIAVLVVCFAALGQSPPLASIVLAYQIGYLTNLIPIPGGVGVLDSGIVGMLAVYGIPATSAAAATVVYHAVALWIPALWGTITFIALRRTRDRPIVLRAARQAGIDHRDTG